MRRTKSSSTIFVRRFIAFVELAAFWPDSNHRLDWRDLCLSVSQKFTSCPRPATCQNQAGNWIIFSVLAAVVKSTISPTMLLAGIPYLVAKFLNMWLRCVSGLGFSPNCLPQDIPPISPTHHFQVQPLHDVLGKAVWAETSPDTKICQPWVLVRPFEGSFIRPAN